MDLRKLDALVAEKIMGCKIRSIENAKDQREFEYLRSNGNYLCGCGLGEHNDTDDEGGYQWLKNYSEEIAAAWEVINKVDGQWTLDGQEQVGWVVSLVEASMREDRYESPFKASAETAPLAICFAALKAKGVDVSEWEK